MAKPLNVSTVTPVSTALKELLSRSNHIKFKKKALIYKVESKIDVLTGATKALEACGQDFKFDTSKSSHHGFIRIRDKRTGVLSETGEVMEDGESPEYDSFDWRTIIFFRFPMDLNIPEIHGHVPGLGWQTINLKNRRFWNAPPMDEAGISEFNNKMNRLAEIRATKDLVKKARDNGKKRKFMEDLTETPVGSYQNRLFKLVKKSGQTDKLFDVNTGEEVKRVRTIQPNKNISLVSNTVCQPAPIGRAESVQDVADLTAQLQVLNEIENELCKSIRETELGLIEDFMIGQNNHDLSEIKDKTIKYGSSEYSVNLSDDSSYDYPNNVVNKLKSGEFEIRTVKTNASWRTVEMTPSETNEMIEMEAMDVE